MSEQKKYFIWGMGLLGASLAIDLKRANHKVFGCVRSEKNLNTLKEMGFEDCWQTADNSLWEAVKISDGIIIGTPIDSMYSILEMMKKKGVPEHIWITDMASTKADIMNWVENTGEKYLFVGSHPMAGSDLGGPEHGRENLFQNATIFVTPSEKLAAMFPENIYENTVSEITAFWKNLNALPYTVAFAVHDKWAAYLSHGLHLASCLVSHLIRDIPEVFDVPSNPSGGSFRDITRVAGSNPQLWEGIIQSNREEVIQYMRSLESLARTWRQSMEKDALPIAEIFEKSNEIRKKIIKSDKK
ncbi:MAG: prephenate dehydrogenase/arogenate dehydrogenase family protein [Spirochaetia bacterium]|nr:prephenate dehydrogenase/arogenate dehydrogenase family protein [Spirochaetia bacterium]